MNRLILLTDAVNEARSMASGYDLSEALDIYIKVLSIIFGKRTGKEKQNTFVKLDLAVLLYNALKNLDARRN
ncbi:MAG TPA: hypothetical protein VHO28_01165 [Ignavibacteriales bacterium]|nr:hypothetical protein [Ignavibacteriales bacterium]HEX3075143.1 hypothetical protein [Ignavibacteriales bacterium]